MKILNYGSLNLDYVYQVPNFVRAGETISALRRDVNIGGKGLNQSIALARAGAEVYHAGCVGKDGKMLTDFLQQNGVNTSLIACVEEPSGHAIIQVEPNGQNCILIHGGANRCITEAQIDAALEQFEIGDFLLLQNEINDIDLIIRKARQKGLTVVLNPSPITAVLLQADLQNVDWFLLNETEGAALADLPDCDVDAVMQALRVKYPQAKFVLTLGSSGARYFDREEHINVAARRVQAVDTTAAGDTFTGFFLGELLRGGTVENALELASCASALTVTKAGAAQSIAPLDQVLEFQKQ